MAVDLSTLFAPSELFSLQLARCSRRQGEWVAFRGCGPGLVDCSRVAQLLGAGGSTIKNQEYSATLRTSWARSSLTALTGYALIHIQVYRFDVGLRSKYVNAFGVLALRGISIRQDNNSLRKFRLSAPIRGGG